MTLAHLYRLCPRWCWCRPRTPGRVPYDPTPGWHLPAATLRGDHL